jgi:pimeloyl-ACP methyl ester carboxylesterase
VFTYLHLAGFPAARCSSALLAREFAHNYRREVLLARALAVAGQAVLRFHYRHTGNSDGDGVDLTFDSMREDALGAIDALRSQAPKGPLTILGTRWGSLIAAAAAAHHPDAAVVLWSPCSRRPGSSRTPSGASSSATRAGRRAGDERAGARGPPAGG